MRKHPSPYSELRNGDAITAGRVVFVFLMGGVVGTLVGAPIADKIGHKYYFCLSMILSVPLPFLFLQVRGFWGFYHSLSGRVPVDLKFFCHDRDGANDSQKSTGDGLQVDMGFVIGMGGVGAGLLGIVADSWGVMTVLKLIVYMPAVDFIPALMIPYGFKTPKG